MKIFLKITTISILTILILELCVRFYLFGFNCFNYYKINSVHQIGVSGLIQPSVYPEIIYELKPGLNEYFKMARVITNTQGLRDQEYQTDKPAGTFRAVVLGDSFAMPVGVNIEDAFHTLIEKRLNAASAAGSYEFINFGVGGYDPRQYLAVLRYKALKYQPDLILFCLCGPFDNGFYDDKYFHRAYQVKPPEHAFFKSFTLEMIRAIILKQGRRSKQWQTASVDKLRAVFLQLSEISKKKNIPVCIVILSVEHIKEVSYNSVKEMAGEYGLNLIDTIPAFKDLKPSDHYIYPLDPHPNATANKIFADVIYAGMQKYNLLPVEEK